MVLHGACRASGCRPHAPQVALSVPVLRPVQLLLLCPSTSTSCCWYWHHIMPCALLTMPPPPPQPPHLAMQEEPAITSATTSTATTDAVDAAASIPAALEPPVVLQYVEPSTSERFWTSVKLAFALPWRRFKKGSVLTFKVCVCVGGG
jgi:hypothetical protein